MPSFVPTTLALVVGAIALICLAPILVWWSRLRRRKQVRDLVASLDGDHASAEGLIDRTNPRALCRAVLDSPGPRWHGFHSLLVGKGLLDTGEVLLRHRDPAKRVAAVQILRSLSVPKGTSLCLVALHDADPSVRHAAIRALTEAHELKAIHALFEAIPTLSDEEKAAAASGLLSAGEEIAAAIELATAYAPDEARMWVADFLASWHCDSAARLLIRLASDLSPGVRAHAATGLVGYSRAQVTPVLKVLLTDEAWFVRVEAIKSLARLDPAEAVNPIAAVLSDPEWWVRKEAAQALRLLGEEGSRALVSAVVHDEQLAREAALGALAETPLEAVVKAAWAAGAAEGSHQVSFLSRPGEVA